MPLPSQSDQGPRVELNFVGRDRRGVVRTGRVLDTPTALARRMFKQGFSLARVHDAWGREVGGIGDSPDDGSRTWWAET